MGSKSKIAEEVLFNLPPADNLYDLFAGGCAITHCALYSKKWKNIYINDIQDGVVLFLNAISGKYKNERRWISREDFFELKDKDPYIRWCWSFGNNGKGYLYGKEVEPVKKLAHEYLLKNGYNGTSQSRVSSIKAFKELARIQGRFQLQSLESLESLQSLERLQRLQSLERLQMTQLDYREVKIKPNSVIYCDPPYKQKKTKTNEKYYGLEFDTLAFYEWAKSTKHPVYFSSSFCDDTFFTEVWSRNKETLMNNKNSFGKKQIIERLYWNNYGEEYKTTLF